VPTDFEFNLDDVELLPRAQKIKLLAQLERMPSAPESTAALVSKPDPRLFITDVLGEKPTAAALSHGIKVPWTPDQDLVMQSLLDNRRTLAQSANSVGKTAIAARCALWWLYRHPNSIVITTAPNKRQVEELLWGQLRELWYRSKVRLPGRCLTTSLIVDAANPRWKAIGFTANEQKGDISATAFQGIHGPYMLAILDESTLIEKQIWEAIEGMLTGPDDRILALGNPTLLGSQFHKNSTSRAWTRVVISALNHPNVVHNDPNIIPGAVSRTWVEDRREEWGDRSPLYVSKILGQFPEQGSDTLIHIGWLESAKARWVEANARALREEDRKGIAAGLDIAGEGSDLTVLSIIQNGAWEIPEAGGQRTVHFGKDVNAAVELVQGLLAEKVRIRILSLDDTGLGQGVTSALRRLQREGKIPRDMWINPVNFGANAWDHERFDQTKDQLWWTAREVLREREFSLPPDEVVQGWGLPSGNSLDAQLMAPIYEQVGGGRLAIYDKYGARGSREKTKSLPTKSPDLAHSFILCVWSWLKLRSNEEPPPPETVTELFAQRLRKMIDGSSIARRNDAKRAHLPPWASRRR